MRAIVTTSWDDGHELDLRLADMLSERGLRGTFYCAPRNRERPAISSDALRRLAEGFEIGAHSLTHRNLLTLPERRMRSEIADGRSELEQVIGRPVEMFCYPKGRYSPQVRQAVAECGFLGARTTRMFLSGLPRDPYLMPTTIVARPYPCYVWALHCARSRSLDGLRVLLGSGCGGSWRMLADALFDHTLAHGGVWHLWGHSWEIERYGMWDEVRAVLDAVAGRDDVDYLTNAEVVRRAQPAS